MSIKKNLAEIISLARGCNGKRVSELNELEAHAIAFCSEFYPAHIDAGGQPKYNKEATEVTLAASYISLRRLIQTVDPTIKGFAANSYHVFADVELPTFKEGSAKAVLECYPNILMIPPKKCEYDHLPRLQKFVAAPYSNVQELKLGIISVLAQVDLSLRSNWEMSPVLMSSYAELKKNEAQALKIANSVGYDITSILESEVEDLRHRGSVDYYALNSESSYLATFLFMASKGVILKVERDV